MMMSAILLMPLMGMVPSDGVQRATIEPDVPAGNVQSCEPAPALWPMNANGEDLPVPEDGIRVILTYDLVDGRVSNVRPNAPQGSDAFIATAITFLMGSCFPHADNGPDQQHAFDFMPEAGPAR